MTAFAACLFALAAAASLHAMLATLRRYGHEALSLRARLAACPETLAINWAMVERVPVPALSALRRDRAVRPRSWTTQRPGLEWPSGELAA
ncbi:hypothetical protein EDF56_101260 [Novosphingobium sp. PhB165]|nr:hypothetical protein EDF56_101260 [Novosphingobium sp. PhB165]